MANKLANAQSDSQGNEESLDSLREGTEEFSGEGNFVTTGSKSSKRLIRWVSPDQALVLSSHITKDSIFKPIQIPKPLVGSDEKYLRRCLDLIHSRASIMAQKMTGSWPEMTSASSFDSVVFESPVSESGSVVIGLGSIIGSQSMANILKSPLFRAPERLVFKDSATPNLSVFSSPAWLEKGDLAVHREVPKLNSSDDDRTAREKRSSSLSSTSSDRTVSTAAIGRAMLQCTWKSGLPNFVISADDQRDVFSANLSRDEKKGLDYEYSFRREAFSDGRSCLAGKMTVSTSLTIGADNSKTAETEFVLFGGSETRSSAEITTGKHRGFPRRMADVFRLSKSSIQEDVIDDHNHDHDCHPPNLELAAIVVKDRIDDDRTEEDEPELGGGWGLKFLKKAGVKVKQPTECDRNKGECSTSMDILIPAGLHGGPGAQNTGPSSLTERWRSGGQCDCGGWDLGCPITVLKPKQNKDDETEDQAQEEFKTFDFVTHGSGPGSLMLRLVNVRDDLYFVHYQRSLSVLQSFSIAVAAIHSRSPNLRPKGVRGRK